MFAARERSHRTVRVCWAFAVTGIQRSPGQRRASAIRKASAPTVSSSPKEPFGPVPTWFGNMRREKKFSTRKQGWPISAPHALRDSRLRVPPGQAVETVGDVVDRLALAVHGQDRDELAELVVEGLHLRQGGRLVGRDDHLRGPLGVPAEEPG